MAERITPTGWGQRKGRPVEQLGTRLAVLIAVMKDGPGGGLIVTADLREREVCLNILHAAGDEGAWEWTSATSGPPMLYEFDPGLVVGVMPGAFDRVPAAVWPDFHAVLMKRFRKVHWG